ARPRAPPPPRAAGAPLPRPAVGSDPWSAAGPSATREGSPLERNDHDGTPTAGAPAPPVPTSRPRRRRPRRRRAARPPVGGRAGLGRSAPRPRGPTSGAAYLAGFLATIPGPIVLVAHSYGGFVITNAATGNPNVRALV